RRFIRTRFIGLSLFSLCFFGRSLFISRRFRGGGRFSRFLGRRLFLRRRLLGRSFLGSGFFGGGFLGSRLFFRRRLLGRSFLGRRLFGSRRLFVCRRLLLGLALYFSILLVFLAYAFGGVGLGSAVNRRLCQANPVRLCLVRRGRSARSGGERRRDEEGTGRGGDEVLGLLHGSGSWTFACASGEMG